MNSSLQKKNRDLNKVHELFDLQMTWVGNKAKRTDRTRVPAARSSTGECSCS
jgi:hypothetical protein